MSDIQLYLLEVDKNKGIYEQNLKLLELFESVGEYVNNEDAAIRGKSLSYLSEVFEAIPPKTLSRQQRELLCEFVTSRVGDDKNIGVGPCARALLALEKLGKWDESRLVNVVSTFLHSTHPLREVGVQSERYAVLQLIDMLMAKYREGLRRMHNSDIDFMARFISYFDGEKDPRNLMVIFSILRVPMTEWDISTDAQDLFDAVFNYFPITFRPPPDDPYGITAQDLKTRLKECIASTSDFAPYSFPALLDKLDSTSMNTKRDVLQTILSCIKEYGAPTIHLYAITLWDALKFEVLNVQEDDLASEALDCLAEISRQLSNGSKAQLKSYLNPITKECNEHLEDTPTKQSQASGGILSSIIVSSQESANMVLSAVLPQIFVLLQNSDNVVRRRGLLEVLAKLIRADGNVFGNWLFNGRTDRTSTVGLEHENVLTKFSERSLNYLTGCLETAPINEVSLRLVTVDGLVQLAKIQSLLSNSEVSRIVNLMNNVIINEESYGRDEVKLAAINGLLEISQQKPHILIEESIPTFMARLPDLDMNQISTYTPTLEALARLGSEKTLFSTIVIRLLSKFNAALQSRSSSEYLAAILNAMLYVFTNAPTEKEGDDVTSFFQKIVEPLLSRCSEETSLGHSPFQNELVLDLVGRLCAAIIRPRPSYSSQIRKRIFSFTEPEGNAESLAFFKKTAPLSEHRLLLISTHLLAAVNRENQPVPPPTDVIPALVAFCRVENLSPRVRASCLRQLSLYVNKFVASAEIRPLVEPLVGSVDQAEAANDNIRIKFSIAKGLMLRNNPFATTLLTNLLSILDQPSYGNKVARGFATLLQPDEFLTRANYCLISGLHVQKTFVALVPALVTDFRGAPKDAKANYLIALSGIIRWVPYDIVDKEVLPTLVPLLLQSLDLLNESDVCLATLSTVSSILTHDAKMFEEHANSLVSRLLSTAKATRSTEQLRAESLKCLALVPSNIKAEILIPLKRSLIKKLLPCLDDGRRSVRAEAVKCQARWSELGEPGDDDD